MEFKVERNQFLNSLGRAQTIVEKKSNMPILSSVLLSTKDDMLEIFATDLEISLRELIPAEVISEGSAAVPCRKLFEIIKESKGTSFYIKKEEKDDHRIFISDGKAEFWLAFLPPEEFPILAEPEEVTYATIEGEELKDMIRKTIYTLSQEDPGFKFSGIFVEKRKSKKGTMLRFVSTDGHRLSLVERKVKGADDLNLDEGILVPKKGMSEINKFCMEGGAIDIGLKDRNLIVKKDNRILIIRLLDVKFPDYENVIHQEHKHTILIDKEEFMDALRKMMILGTEKYKAVKLIIKKETMDLISTNVEIGEAHEALDIEHKGEPMEEEKMEIGFNPRFLMDVLQAMDSKKINFSFTDKDKACVITGDDDPNFLALIMPLRI